MQGIVQSIHPSSDQLYDLLSREEWEGLAVYASEGIGTGLPTNGVTSRLGDLGLLGAGQRPTAAGYALLFTWLRRNPKQTIWSAIREAVREMVMAVTKKDTELSERNFRAGVHQNRMRLLLLNGDILPADET